MRVAPRSQLRYHLPEEVLADRQHPITRALWDAFHSIEGWTRLEHAIQAEHLSGEHGPLTLAINWLDTYGQIAKAQIPTRDPHGINSTGPVEQVLVRSTDGSATASGRSRTARASPSCST